ncbi:sister chromatid cohesion 1 protein 2 isoform X3 [Helianthus annuus]|nr:sister chromatid cohesion 1 protein 2 isoform X3 [Helianthus annuus]
MGTITEQLSTKTIKDKMDRLLTAAHFPQRVKKELVDKTNICESVDIILVKQFPVVTYRTLAYYLVGLVRIHSKKVEYLLVDCNRSLNEIKFFSDGRKKTDVNYGGTCLPESSTQRSQLKVVDVNSTESSRRKNSYSFLESMRAQFTSLSMPDNFDLDAYDLEIVEADDSSDDHVRPHLELVLADAWENRRTLRHTFGKDDTSASTSSAIASINPNTSVEKFRQRFVLEECLEPIILGESDDEFVLDSVPSTEQEHEPEWNTNTDSTMMSEGVQTLETNPDEECTATGQTVVSEMTSVDKIMLKPSPNKSQLSVTVDVTPQSKAPVVSGKRKSEPVAVRTPASREHVRAPQKRKCVYDYAVVIPNEVYKTWVSDASDLARRRRTCSDVLNRKEPRSVDYFTQPQISINAGIALEHRSIISAEQVMQEKVQETVGPAPLNVHKSSGAIEDEVIAPQTPATHPTPLRFDEVHEISMVNPMRPTSPSESVERAMFPITGVNEAEMHRDEGPSSLGEDNQENVLVAEKLSAATKTVGSYLHDNFVRSQEKGEEAVVNLSQLLKKKTKKESARFFYQMLVLKTGGYIDVKQEKPYDEICVKQTPKLQEAFGSGSRE